MDKTPNSAQLIDLINLQTTNCKRKNWQRINRLYRIETLIKQSRNGVFFGLLFISLYFFHFLRRKIGFPNIENKLSAKPIQ